MIDRKKFYDAVRFAPFHNLNQGQVDGMNAILDEWDKRGLTEISWLAYMLATSYHETASFMLPVIETRQASEARNPSVDTAIARLEHAWTSGRLPWVKQPYWRKDRNGKSWLGRGFVQLTFEANYLNAQNKTGILCHDHPELMLEIAPAATVMFGGMIGGWFTGRKLSDYLGGKKLDFLNARRIINGTDRAAQIAHEAENFISALQTATA